MTCAKKVVTCILVAVDGEKFTGTNNCDNPQPICPRLPGEKYEKCTLICEQEGHAEDMALEEALKKNKAKGAAAYLFGINHYCRECQNILFEAGVVALRLGVPPQ